MAVHGSPRSAPRRTLRLERLSAAPVLHYQNTVRQPGWKISKLGHCRYRNTKRLLSGWLFLILRAWLIRRRFGWLGSSDRSRIGGLVVAALR